MTRAKEEHKPDTEQRILEAAEQEFISKGFDGARTTSIAEHAGVTHAMLHYYFRTKEKLFNRVLGEKMIQMRKVMCVFINDDGLPFLENVRRGVERHFDYIAANPELPLFVSVEMRRNPDCIKDFILDNKSVAHNVRQSLQAGIDKGVKEGICREMDALMLMMDIVSINIFSVLGIPIFSCLFPECVEKKVEFLEKRKKECVETILSRLRI